MADRTALEDERDFCLRSLRDLDAERDAGDLSDDDYAALRDAYVARAAAALRALDAPPAPSSVAVVASNGHVAHDEPSDPPARRRRRPGRRSVLIGVAVVAVLGGIAGAVVAGSSPRQQGEEITGQALGAQAEAQTIQAATTAAAKGDTVTALKDYQKVLQGNPTQVEALTGEGWILAQTQQPAYLQQGIGLLGQAERASPSYPPAHLYRGISLLSEDDYTDAIPELQWYLAHNPDPSLVKQVRQALLQAQSKAKAAG